jgi:hypothetical protein
MHYLKSLSAVALIVATFPFAAANAQGWGPCTPAAGVAVGVAGPAMNGGQLMAGVGQCRRIGGDGYGYGYGWGGGPYAWGGPYAPPAAVRSYGGGPYGGPYYGGPYAADY